MKKYLLLLIVALSYSFLCGCSDESEELILVQPTLDITRTETELLTTGIQQDSIALVALYKATNGPCWNRRRNWLKTNVCFWQGVKVAEVDGEPRVIWLDLACSGLSGTLPKEIRNLTALQRLILSYNEELTGPLINEIFELKQLITLNTNFSGFTGTLSPSIANLTELDTLTMWNYLPDENGKPYKNRLNGSIPAELGKLQKLRYLRFGRQGFSGAIPSEIGAMRSLRFLDLAQCSLSGTIPATLGDLPAIQEIYLFENQLSGTLPDGLMKSKTLDIFSAHHNQLSGRIPESICGLTNLTILKLSYNQLSGPLPEALTRCAKLSIINLNNNTLSGDLPAWTGYGFPNLTAIDLSSNQFTGNLPERKGQFIPGAGTFYPSFYVSGNCLTGTVPEGFMRFIHGEDEQELRSRLVPQQDGFGFNNLQ